MQNNKDLERIRPDEAGRLAEELERRMPQDILQATVPRGGRVALSFSGAEDVVLVDMVHRLGLGVEVFSLDTGRLHPATLEFIDRVRAHYQIPLRVLNPARDEVERLVLEKGLFSFRADGHGECCEIRKVEPLRRHLQGKDMWITGQRIDQSPTRADLPVVQEDQGFGGPDHPLIKVNPLARWTSRDVWEYLRYYEVPWNSLHEEGFISIGCAPCTRPVLPGQHEREGRWWWEDENKKECGLHAINQEGEPDPG